MIDTPVQTTIPARQVAAIHLRIPLAAMREEFSGATQEISKALQQQGIRPAGPIFAHHLQRPTDTFDFNICFPVERPVQPIGRVQSIDMPALPVIQTTYHGDYSGLPHAWPEFMSTPQVQIASVRGDFIETYTFGPHEDAPPAEWRTTLSIILTPTEKEESAEA